MRIPKPKLSNAADFKRTLKKYLRTEHGIDRDMNAILQLVDENPVKGCVIAAEHNSTCRDIVLVFDSPTSQIYTFATYTFKGVCYYRDYIKRYDFKDQSITAYDPATCPFFL